MEVIQERSMFSGRTSDVLTPMRKNKSDLLNSVLTGFILHLELYIVHLFEA